MIKFVNGRDSGSPIELNCAGIITSKEFLLSRNTHLKGGWSPALVEIIKNLPNPSEEQHHFFSSLNSLYEKLFLLKMLFGWKDEDIKKYEEELHDA